MARDFVVLKIDTERHTNGAEVAARLRGDRTGGIPWTVVTDASGAELVAGDGPEGNIGCPVSPAECAWFVEMIRRSAQHLEDADVALIAAELEKHALPLRR